VKRDRARQFPRLKIPRGSRLVRVRLPPPAPLSRPPSDTYGDRGSTQPRARRPPWGNRGAIRGKLTRLGKVDRRRGDLPLVWAERRWSQAGQALQPTGRRRGRAVGPRDDARASGEMRGSLGAMERSARGAGRWQPRHRANPLAAASRRCNAARWTG